MYDGKLLNSNDIIKEVLDGNYTIITNNSDYSTEAHIIDEISDKLNKFKEEYENKLQEKRLLLEQELQSQDIEFMVEDAKLQFQKDLLETKKALSEARSNYDNLITDYPLDIQAIIDTEICIENFTDAIERMERLSIKFGFSEEEK